MSSLNAFATFPASAPRVDVPTDLRDGAFSSCGKGRPFDKRALLLPRPWLKPLVKRLELRE